MAGRYLEKIKLANQQSHSLSGFVDLQSSYIFLEEIFTLKNPLFPKSYQQFALLLSNALPVGVSPSFPLFFIIHFPTGVSAGWKEFFVVIFLCFFPWFKKLFVEHIFLFPPFGRYSFGAFHCFAVIFYSAKGGTD